MKILVSNDDGIFHPGIWALVRAVKDLGEVFVVAPDRNQSGIGTAMTLHNPVRVKEVPATVPNVTAYAVEGTPADAVVIGLRELVPTDVDIVLSGINPGNNITTNVLVSGTIGAAYAGHLNGICSMAISVGNNVDVDDKIVGLITRSAVNSLTDERPSINALININFPSGEQFPVKDCEITSPAPRVLQDYTRLSSEDSKPFYWIFRDRIPDIDLKSLPENSDVLNLEKGYVTISSLSWCMEEETEKHVLQNIKQNIQNTIQTEM